MRIAVTGAAGFIGSHLTRVLVSQGHSVWAIDNLHTGTWARLEDIEGAFLPVQVDIRDVDLLTSAFSGAQVVFHFAALSNVMRAAREKEYLNSTNVMGTHVVCRAAEGAGVSKVVFASSREVYGEANRTPVQETARLEPKNEYGYSKVVGEAIVDRFERLGAFQAMVARLANVYGPYDKGRVIPIFLERAMANKPLEIYGGGQIIDFLWIDHLADALVSSLDLPELPCGPINIGSGVGTPIVDLAKRIIEATGSDSEIRMQPARPMEVERFVADVSRAKEQLDLVVSDDPLEHLPTLVAHSRGAPLQEWPS